MSGIPGGGLLSSVFNLQSMGRTVFDVLLFVWMHFSLSGLTFGAGVASALGMTAGATAATGLTTATTAAGAAAYVF